MPLVGINSEKKTVSEGGRGEREEEVKAESMFPVTEPSNQNSPSASAPFFFLNSIWLWSEKKSTRMWVQLHCEKKDGRTGTGEA